LRRFVMHRVATEELATTRHRARAVLRSVLLACAALVALVAVPGQASASSSGCTYGGQPVDRCVYVNGSGTYVNYVEGRIVYRTGLWLEIEVWGDGFYYRGHGDPGAPSDTTKVRLDLKRHLADRSWVCVAARWTDGSQVSPACVQIRR
jgi:hypothetical protein